MDPVTLMTCITLTVYDGDTLRCDGQRIRPMGNGAPNISGFDTPEIGWRAKCEKEHELGTRAAARLEELIQTPGLKIEDSGVIDHFDRPLVWLRLPDGSTVGNKLIEEGYAKVWLPGKSKFNWCAD